MHHVKFTIPRLWPMSVRTNSTSSSTFLKTLISKLWTEGCINWVSLNFQGQTALRAESLQFHFVGRTRVGKFSRELIKGLREVGIRSKLPGSLISDLLRTCILLQYAWLYIPYVSSIHIRSKSKINIRDITLYVPDGKLFISEGCVFRFRAWEML